MTNKKIVIDVGNKTSKEVILELEELISRYKNGEIEDEVLENNSTFDIKVKPIQWEEIETNIDFSKETVISESSGTHVCEEIYLVNGDMYRLLYEIGNFENPQIEIAR